MMQQRAAALGPPPVVAGVGPNAGAGGGAGAGADSLFMALPSTSTTRVGCRPPQVGGQQLPTGLNSPEQYAAWYQAFPATAPTIGGVTTRSIRAATRWGRPRQPARPLLLHPRTTTLRQGRGLGTLCKTSPGRSSSRSKRAVRRPTTTGNSTGISRTAWAQARWKRLEQAGAAARHDTKARTPRRGCTGDSTWQLVEVQQPVTGAPTPRAV